MGNLQPRDIEILLRIYRWRYMTRQQIEGIFFPSGQTAKVRIEKLLRYGLIRESNILPSTPIFLLASRGEATLKKYFEEQGKQANFSRVTLDRRSVRHHIETNDFQMALVARKTSCVKTIHEKTIHEKTIHEKTIRELSLQGSSLHSDQKNPICSLFLPYYLTVNGFNQRLTQCQNADSTRNADALFILTKEGKSRLFILELDRGTQSISGALLDMVKFYQEFLIEKNFRLISNRFNLPEFDLFRLLIVTSSRARAENIRKAALRISNRVAEALRFFWVTGIEIDPGNVYEPIWNSMDLFDVREYSLKG